MATNGEHIIALEPLEKGLVGTLLRYLYEVRSAEEYFDEIQLDLAKQIVNQKSGRFSPDKFEDQYETALIDLALGIIPILNRDSRSKKRGY